MRRVCSGSTCWWAPSWGIRYVAQAIARDKGHNQRLANIGITYASEDSEMVISRLKVLECSDRRLDADLIEPAFGGLFGDLDADTAYDRYFDMAAKHERAKPAEPWTFIVHPFVSGNRAWSSFERFMRRLHGEFGSNAFKTARQVTLGAGQPPALSAVLNAP